MKLAIITALFQRYHTWEIFAHMVRRLRKIPGLEIEVMAAGSEPGISDAFATREGWNYVFAPNPEIDANHRLVKGPHTLGRKWNTALMATYNLEPDYVLAMGQDDICDNRYIELIMDRASRGKDYLAALDCYFHNLETGETRYWPGYSRNTRRRGEPIGAGRCFSRDLLEKVNWELWPNNQNGSLDYHLMQKLKGVKHTHEFFSLVASKSTLMDLKDANSLTSWNKLHGSRVCQLPHVFSREELDLIKGKGAKV